MKRNTTNSTKSYFDSHYPCHLSSKVLHGTDCRWFCRKALYSRDREQAQYLFHHDIPESLLDYYQVEAQLISSNPKCTKLLNSYLVFVCGLQYYLRTSNYCFYFSTDKPRTLGGLRVGAVITWTTYYRYK